MLISARVALTYFSVPADSTMDALSIQHTHALAHTDAQKRTQTRMRAHRHAHTDANTYFA